MDISGLLTRALQDPGVCPASGGIDFDHLENVIYSMLTSHASMAADKCDCEDTNFEELDFPTIKAHELQSLLIYIVSSEDDESSANDDQDYNFDELDQLATIKADKFESLQAFLAPIQDDKRGSDAFNFDAIIEHVIKCSKHQSRTKVDMFKDIFTMVLNGLNRGNIRKDQFEKRAGGGDEKIKELAFRYKIPIRSAPGEMLALQSDTLTFVRAVTCFPHFASMFLYKGLGLAKDGAKSVLASSKLPRAMKHAGFPGLIPKGCDPYLMKAYLYAHAAYMVDFGMLINPGDTRSLKKMALSQLNFSKVGVDQVPYTDEFRADILSGVGLTHSAVFKKIVDVCNNLCKVVGEPKLKWAKVVKYHIKNDMVCFFKDESKDVGAIGFEDFNFDQRDFASIKADEYESLLMYFACTEDDKQHAYGGFNFDEESQVATNQEADFESMLAFLAPIEMMRDIFEMVLIGICRGNVRKDEVERVVRGGAERIKELAFWYKIPIRSAAGETIPLQSYTLTFALAITCFPHIASLLLDKAIGLAKNGAKSVLASEQLPNAMKHAGFFGLIPKGSDPYLMKAYLFAHVAFMVDFGKLINPGV
ncbi:hypothetical protein QVD17_10696 [Tagetes erecta]|uniref:Nucleocapsid protein n=1 Tax=Tagetes erecta TaxID=13708 RepID=A0AAD8L3V8_TARER|nr:hypothetical protein QVD17_10696 [Tagetes erecta]